jgi:hypothetical protein
MNQLQSKAATLAQILSANGLTKNANETITHTRLHTGADPEVKADVQGVLASSNAANNTNTDNIESIPGVQDLNKTPQQVLAASGTSVKELDENEPQGKTAAYRHQLASIIDGINKQANFRTGTEVLSKIASYGENPDQQQQNEVAEELHKLASTNPVFNILREQILMEKIAQDITDLADAEGISEEEAADVLDAAAEENPEMEQELEDEATGEALAELAGAEEEAAMLDEGIGQMAMNASEALGTEVTPDDIVAAADEVVAQAEELGVDPLDLIAAAAEDMEGGIDGEEPSPESMEEAEAILEAAAAEGISPDEVIAAAAEELEGGAPMEEPVVKEASYRTSDRVAYVRSLFR